MKEKLIKLWGDPFKILAVAGVSFSLLSSTFLKVEHFIFPKFMFDLLRHVSSSIFVIFFSRFIWICIFSIKEILHEKFNIRSFLVSPSRWSNNRNLFFGLVVIVFIVVFFFVVRIDKKLNKIQLTIEDKPNPSKVDSGSSTLGRISKDSTIWHHQKSKQDSISNQPIKIFEKQKTETLNQIPEKVSSVKSESGYPTQKNKKSKKKVNSKIPQPKQEEIEECFIVKEFFHFGIPTDRVDEIQLIELNGSNYIFDRERKEFQLPVVPCSGTCKITYNDKTTISFKYDVYHLEY